MSENFRRKGRSPDSRCCCQKTKVIAISCGIKMLTVSSFVSTQSMRMTDGQTDGQNYDSYTALALPYLISFSSAEEIVLFLNCNFTESTCVCCFQFLSSFNLRSTVVLTLDRRGTQLATLESSGRSKVGDSTRTTTMTTVAEP